MESEQDITLTKLEIAEHQLEQALRLYLDESDFVSAITLAGASEEILGKIRERNGDIPELKSSAQECVMVGRHVFGEEWTEKTFVGMANYFRNGLKHYTDGQPITVTKAAAAEILDRAISNYFMLTGSETVLMHRFMDHERNA